MSGRSSVEKAIWSHVVERIESAGGRLTAYPTSRIKRRRATKAEVAARRSALFQIVAEQRPMTVRQVFYQATVQGLVDKTENGYGQVQTDLALMRRAGQLPYDWLADNTRWQRKPRSYTNIEAALREAASYYRRDLWADAGSYVEIWLEKDALAGVIEPITRAYDVPLMVARGYASLSFLHAAAETISAVGVPTYLYHLGDYDPSGVNAGEKIEQTIRELAPGAEIHFQRIAVTESQIERLGLPSRPTKQSDSRAKGFGPVSVELDAMRPAALRALVEYAIRRHMPEDYLEEMRLAEDEDRRQLSEIADKLFT